MRMLHSVDRERVLTATRNYLSSTGFMFEPFMARVISGTHTIIFAHRCCLDSFGLINIAFKTGEEEAAFGWMTVNYALGKLQGDPEATVGALDMGGASTQITFVPSGDVLADCNAPSL